MLKERTAGLGLRLRGEILSAEQLLGQAVFSLAMNYRVVQIESGVICRKSAFKDNV